MLREADVVGFLGWVDDTVGTLLQRTFELGSLSLRSLHKKCENY